MTTRTPVYAALLLGLLTAATAAAAPKLSAQSIIVNPAQSALDLKVWTDKDPSGQRNPRYAVGENIALGFTASQDAYVYLFNVNGDGQIDLFYPNRYSESNFVPAGTTRSIPVNGKYTLSVGGPAGQDRLLGLASTTRLNIDQIASFAGSQGFATVRVRGQERLAQAISGLVTPLPQDSWTTDVAYFLAGNAQPAYGYVEPVQAPAPAQQPVQPQPPITAPAPGARPAVTTIQPGEYENGNYDEAVQAAYTRTKGEDSLGQATSYVTRWGTGQWQKFDGVAAYGKAVVLHADGSGRAYAVHGRILERYLALAQADNGGGRPPKLLGWAAGDEKIITRNSYGTTGLYGYFQSGALYFSEKHGTYWLTGDLLKRYQGLGGSGSFLGFPLRDQYRSGAGWGGDFEGGSIRYVNGVYVVRRN